MTVNYGNTITSMKPKIIMGYNYVNEPATNVVWSNAYIASVAKKATQLQLPTSIFPALDPAVPGNHFPGIPMKYPNLDSNAEVGAEVSYGMFFPKYVVNDQTTVTATQNRWQVREYGIDTRFSLENTERRAPYPEILRDCYYTTAVTLSSGLANSGANVSIPVPAGLFITGIWVERIGSGSWWPPMISIAPHGDFFPTNGANIVIRIDMPGADGHAWNYVGNTYRIRVAGLLNPPFTPTVRNIPVGVLTANSGVFVTNTIMFPAGFRLLGMYQVGKNGSNYYSRPWGVTSNLRFDSSSITVITANPAFVSGQTRGASAGDLAVRVVGI
jgi:hypothetical protein